MKDEIESALVENRTLAESYVENQTCHMDQKNAFISSYEKALIAHDSLKDKENVSQMLFCCLLLLFSKLVMFSFFRFHKYFHSVKFVNENRIRTGNNHVNII